MKMTNLYKFYHFNPAKTVCFYSQYIKLVEQEQELIFPRKVRAKRVRIQMKGQVNGYFGITFVQFIGEENPIFRIQSGITSFEVYKYIIYR